jgi:hypothetical protein
VNARLSGPLLELKGSLHHPSYNMGLQYFGEFSRIEFVDRLGSLADETADEMDVVQIMRFQLTDG